MTLRKSLRFIPSLAAALLCLVCAGCAETAGSVYLYVDDSAAHIQNESGKVMQLADGQLTGDLEALDVVSQSEYGCMVEVPYSDSFVFAGSKDKKVQYSVLSSLERTAGTEYTLTGTGVTSAAISPDGKMLVEGSKFAFEAFGSMRNDVLGSYGNVRLSGTAEGSLEVCFDEQNGTIFFDGAVPAVILMTVNGDVSAKSVAITNLDNGTISLAELANGTVNVTDASGNILPIQAAVSIT